MYKFLGKLLLLLIGVYLLFQIPFYQDTAARIKAAFNEKVGNVITEIDRIRGKVDATKERVDQAKDAAIEFKDKVAETKEDIDKALNTVKKATDIVDSALEGIDELKGEDSEEGGLEEAVETTDETNTEE